MVARGLPAEQPDGLPAVSLGNPGFLFIFNASDWANQWRGVYWRESLATNCTAEPPDELFALQPGVRSEEPDGEVEREKARLREALQGYGLEFPADFTAVAERDGAVVWRLQSD